MAHPPPPASGDAEGLYRLGRSYYHGLGGVVCDYEQALLWYGKAAALGHGGALWRLGYMHEHGVGSSGKNLVQALALYGQAHARGTECASDIARVDAELGADPALRTTAVVAVAKAADELRAKEKALMAMEWARVQQVDTAQKRREAEQQRRDEELQRRDATQKLKEVALQRLEKALQRLETTLRQREDALKREREPSDTVAPTGDKPSDVVLVKPSDVVPVKPGDVVPAKPSGVLTVKPSDVVTVKPGDGFPAKPSGVLTVKPSDVVTVKPSDVLTVKPSDVVTVKPSDVVTVVPNDVVTLKPSDVFKVAKPVHPEVVKPNDEDTAARRAVAAARRAQILAERRTDGRGYASKRDAIAASWAQSAVDLFRCQPCASPIAPGQSVLLDKCLHSICRACLPHVLRPADKTVRCPVCKVVSAVVPDAPAQHPFIDGDAAVSAEAARRDCGMCLNDPEDERLPATNVCSTCAPPKWLCDPHTSLHRARQPAHTIAPPPDGIAALRCATHDKPIEAYCNACHVLICLACFTSAHPVATHSVRLLTDMAFVESVRARLVDAAMSARIVADALLADATDATVAVAEVDERDTAIRAEVDRDIDTLIGLLERRRTVMHARCLTHSLTERELLQQTREESEYHWRIITSAADLAEQLAARSRLGERATAVMLQLAEAATSRIAAASGLEPPGVPAPAILRFVVSESLSQQLLELGQIVQD